MAIPEKMKVDALMGRNQIKEIPFT